MRRIRQHVAAGRLCRSGLLLSLAIAGCADTEAPMVVRHRAMLAEQRGDWETALKTRDQFLEDAPDYPFRAEVYFEQGLTHLDQGNLEKSAEYLSKAIEEDDRFLQAYSRRCQVNSMLGRYQDAILDGNRAVELSVSDRDLADVFLHQANSEAELERPERAIVKWRMALVLNPEHLDALGRLFRTHLNLDEANEALELIENSLELNDQIPVKHAYYSEVLARLGRMEEAEKALERAHELNIGNELPLPESIEQFTANMPIEDAFEEAPVVRMAAKPILESAGPDMEAAISVAQTFLQEQGTESALLDADSTMLRCRDEDGEYEVLIKTVTASQPQQFTVTQDDLAQIAAQSPPRGLLLVSLPESGDSPGRVAAFTKSWRPDPFRLTPREYQYQLPAPAEQP